jgi:hypothetical protein
MSFVANKPSPVAERPTRKEREDIACDQPANSVDVISIQIVTVPLPNSKRELLKMIPMIDASLSFEDARSIHRSGI